MHPFPTRRSSDLSKASRGGLSQDRRCPVHVATDLRRTMLRFFSDSARELGLPASGEVPAVWAKSPESEISITLASGLGANNFAHASNSSAKTAEIGRASCRERA